jgi:uncharacterized protein YoxC
MAGPQPDFGLMAQGLRDIITELLNELTSVNKSIITLANQCSNLVTHVESLTTQVGLITAQMNAMNNDVPTTGLPAKSDAIDSLTGINSFNRRYFSDNC